MLPCLLSLGVWQVQRAGEKRQILDRVAARRSEAPITMEQLLRRSQPAYSQLGLNGRYLPGQVILLDNRIYQGNFGYEVVMPFHTSGGELLLVSRGWVAGSLRREQLPELEPVSGNIELLGEVYVPLGEAFTLADSPLPEGWPKRIQVLDIGALAEMSGVEFYPYVVRLRPGSATAFDSYWQDVNILPEKHTAYAVQWFAMALALLVLYLAVAFGFLKSVRVEMD
jgi:surfeit locus 1 family protein